MELKYITRGNIPPSGLPQVYFTGHPQDYALFLQGIAGDILASQNCAVYYDARPETAWEEEALSEELGQMKLFVIPVTHRFLSEGNRALETELPFAMAHHIPVLPLAQEEGLEDLFNRKCGNLQMLERSGLASDEKHRAGDVLSYEEKLEKRLSSILIGDELAAKIRASFDAYIFLSYRKKDRAYAQKLMRLIHKNDFCRDIAIWYDEFLNPGEDFSSAIASELEKSDLFAMAVTPSLLEDQNYVMMQEYPKARETGKPILPVELKPTNEESLHEKYEDLPACVDAGNEKALSDALLENLQAVVRKGNDVDPQHNFLIGLAYLAGVDVEVDHARAVALITGAAEAGLVDAAKKLVDMYRTGNGVPLDYRKAIQWQKRVVALLRRNLEKSGSPDDAYSLSFQQLILGDYCMELPDPAQARDAYAKALDTCMDIAEAGRRAAEEIPNLQEPDLEQFPLMLMWVQAGRDVKEHLPVCYDSLGDACSALGQLEEAREYYERSLEINREAFEEEEDSEAETGSVKHRLVISLQRLGDWCQKTGDAAGAHRYYQELEALVNRGGRLRDQLIMCSKRGDECRLQRDWKQAEVYYDKQCRLAERLHAEKRSDESREDLAYSYGRMAEVCWSTGRLAEAEEYTRKNLAVCTEWYEKSPSWNALYAVALAWFHMGIICQRREEPDAAVEHHLRALNLRRQLCRQSQTKQILEAIVASDLALMELLLSQGRLKDACTCGMEMYDAGEADENEPCMDTALSNLFRIAILWCEQSQKLIDSGRDEAALDALDEAREIGKYISDKGRTVYNDRREAVSLQPMAAVIQYNLALAHMRLGHFEQAMQAAYRGGELYTKLFQESGREDYGESAAQCWEFLGLTYEKRNDFDQTVFYLRQAVGMRRKLYDQFSGIRHLPALAEDGVRLGTIRLKQGNWREAAEQFYQSSRFLTEHYQQTNDSADLALNCQAVKGLGDVCWGTENYKDAKVHYEDALDCAALVSKTGRFPFTQAEAGGIFQRLASICALLGNPGDAAAYGGSAYKCWKLALSESPSEANRDGFARAALALGNQNGDRALIQEAYDQWDWLCARHPENEEYRKRRWKAEEALG